MIKKIISTTAICLVLSSPAFATGSIDGSLNTNNNNDTVDSNNNTTTDSTISSGNITDTDTDITHTNSNNTSTSNSHNGVNNGTTNHNNYNGATTVHNEPGNKTVTQKIDTNQVAPATVSNLTTSANTCHGSVTGGLTLPGVGAVSGGSTTIDENCQMIQQVQLLTKMGLKDAAVCLMFYSDETMKQAISVAYPALKQLCEPTLPVTVNNVEPVASTQWNQPKAEPSWIQTIDAEGRVNLEVIPPKNGKEYQTFEVKERWLKRDGTPCSNRKMPLVGFVKTCQNSN